MWWLTLRPCSDVMGGKHIIYLSDYKKPHADGGDTNCLRPQEPEVEKHEYRVIKNSTKCGLGVSQSKQDDTPSADKLSISTGVFHANYCTMAAPPQQEIIAVFLRLFLKKFTLDNKKVQFQEPAVTCRWKDVQRNTWFSLHIPLQTAP